MSSSVAGGVEEFRTTRMGEGGGRHWGLGCSLVWGDASCRRACLMRRRMPVGVGLAMTVVVLAFSAAPAAAQPPATTPIPPPKDPNGPPVSAPNGPQPLGHAIGDAG